MVSRSKGLRVGWEEVEALSSISHTGVDGRRDSSRISALGAHRLPSIMLEATFLGGKGSQVKAPCMVDGLISWKG